MRLQKYMVNEMSLPTWILTAFGKIKKEISKMTYTQFEKECEMSFKEILSCVDPDKLLALSKKLNIDVKDLKKTAREEELFDLEQELGIPTNMRYYKSKNKQESVAINEDAKHWWDLLKTEMFPTLAFYPALQVWLEFDKMLKGTEYSGKAIAFYAAFWLLLVSGKYIKGWLDWKKTSPDEYSKERAVGAGGII